MEIAVLALQGAFAEHERMLDELGAGHFQIRKKEDLEQPHDGLIIPGGESTVMAKLLRDLELFDPIRDEIRNGLPVFGTCAGLILLAAHIEGEEDYGFGTMDMTAKRHASGRQLGSFHVNAGFKGSGEVPMTFIRAPYISQAGDNVEVLATVDGRIVAAGQQNQLATAFHPELTESVRVHRFFLDMVGRKNMIHTPQNALRRETYLSGSWM